jgi:hypothetical protein
MAAEEQGGARRPGLGIRIALAVSLAANLAVAGVIGGTLLGEQGRSSGPRVRDIGFGPFTAALSPEDRATLGRAFRDQTTGMRSMRAEVAQLVAALRSDPFDEASLRAAIAAQDARGRARLELGQRLLADRLIAMTPPERSAFADRLEHITERGHHGSRGGSRQGD